MTEGTRPEDITLLDLLIDGFEKNEVLHGWHWRDAPMRDERLAVQKFGALVEEAQKWKGPPAQSNESSGRRLAAWYDLEIRQAGRGIMVRAKAPRVSRWWHDRQTWEGDPMGPIFEWIREDETRL
jgi:hypothetical protein